MYAGKYCQNCQKLKHCSTFLIYNDVHYHIPSVVNFQKQKGKQTEMTDAPRKCRSRERDYITREREEEEEDRRERTSYIDYLYVTSLLCNPVLRRTGRGGTKLVITQLNAGIIEKFTASSPRPYLLR